MRVANFPGITVEKKEGTLKNGITLTDLPGTYSINPNSPEEEVTINILKEKNYDIIINVLDSCNPEKSLCFTLQLLELKKPLIVALNMADLAKKQGVHIDIPLLSHLLGVAVIPISAKTGLNISALEDAALHLKVSASSFGKNLYLESQKIIDMCVTKTKSNNISKKIDSILMYPKLSLFFFVLIIASVFAFVFSPWVSALSGMLECLLTETFSLRLGRFLSIYGASPILVNFLCDGILPGMGAVLSFLPQMSILFITLTLLEDSGYMARASFIADYPLKKIGLSGKSFVPLLLGFGCTTSAIMSARTVGSPRDRLVTVLVLPFISCSAKLPVYLYFGEKFFGSRSLIIAAAMYFPGIIIAALSSFIFSGKNSSDSFMLELPPYRIPSFKSVLTEAFVRIRSFLARAGSIIFLSCTAVWLLQNISIKSVSILSLLGSVIAPIFSPLGFNFPEATASLVTGITAKESIISTLSVLCGRKGVEGLFTSASALSFMTFIALYPPCVSAISSMSREIGKKWVIFSFVYQTLIAYVCATLVYFLACILSI